MDDTKCQTKIVIISSQFIRYILTRLATVTEQVAMLQSEYKLALEVHHHHTLANHPFALHLPKT